MKIKIQKKNLLRLILCVMLAALSGICLIFVHLMASALPDQSAARFWDKSGDSRQLSAFISEEVGMTDDQLTPIRRSFDAAMTEAGLSVPSDSSVRLWIDAYSTRGKLTLKTVRTEKAMDVLGVGGDFFLIHPYRLLCGSYFSESELVHNRVVLDETAAWQLFGAIEVEGMSVSIGDRDFIVSGVIENQTDRATQSALNQTPLIFVPYEALEQPHITCYEAILPEPVKGLAFTTFAGQFSKSQEKIQLRENSVRYRFWNLIKQLPQFAKRCIQTKPIIYPFWENAALYTESYALLFSAGVILFAIYPAICLIVLLCICWHRRKWHFSDLKNWIENKIDENNAKIYERRSRRFQKTNNDLSKEN